MNSILTQKACLLLALATGAAMRLAGVVTWEENLAGWPPGELAFNQGNANENRPQQEPAKPREDGFVPLFNGQDLTGWEPCNIAPETFVARGGMIITTGSPIGTLRTDRMYENFIIEFEWQHMKPAATPASSSGRTGCP